MANKAAGKGYENENFYSDIKFQFLGIENIHVMRNSLQKLIDGRFALKVQIIEKSFHITVFQIMLIGIENVHILVSKCINLHPKKQL